MAQNLTTNILINARTGTGFSQVGATLTELGSIVDGLSQRLINFGEESIDVYRNYELSMRDATDLAVKITALDGQTLQEWVTGNTASLAAAINSYNGRTITVNIAGNKLFASGGRATSASIFGEAGPEWAIPEEHSERTAELLNAARAASGFTWPDLLARFGGLNANANHIPTTLVYSPTVNAVDVRGVTEALQRDREDLKRWLDKYLAERRMMDEIAIYR